VVTYVVLQWISSSYSSGHIRSTTSNFTAWTVHSKKLKKMYIFICLLVFYNTMKQYFRPHFDKIIILIYVQWVFRVDRWNDFRHYVQRTLWQLTERLCEKWIVNTTKTPTNRKKPPTCRKSLTNFYRVYLTWTGFELTTLVAICTDCIGSWKFNYMYHKITTTTNLIHVQYVFKRYMGY